MLLKDLLELDRTNCRKVIHLDDDVEIFETNDELGNSIYLKYYIRGFEIINNDEDENHLELHIFLYQKKEK